MILLKRPTVSSTESTICEMDDESAARDVGAGADAGGKDAGVSLDKTVDQLEER